MNKKFPLLFPVLVDHFKAIKGSSDDPDETDFEWSEGNFNFKVKEYFTSQSIKFIFFRLFLP